MQFSDELNKKNFDLLMNSNKLVINIYGKPIG